jgi:hypothetical protein
MTNAKANTNESQSTSVPTKTSDSAPGNDTPASKPNPNVQPPQYQAAMEGYNPDSDIKKVLNEDK